MQAPSRGFFLRHSPIRPSVTTWNASAQFRREWSNVSRVMQRGEAGWMSASAMARFSLRRKNGAISRPDSISAALKKLGYEAHCLPIEELDYRDCFNVISMADVLEHMPFPKTGLAAAYGLLRQNGVLFLSMPNMENMVWRLLHANKVNPYWGEIEHYHNFSRKRLYALLQDHGFAPVEYHVSERYRVCMEVIAVKR